MLDTPPLKMNARKPSWLKNNSYLFFWSSSLVARVHTVKLWRSGSFDNNKNNKMICPLTLLKYAKYRQRRKELQLSCVYYLKT